MFAQYPPPPLNKVRDTLFFNRCIECLIQRKPSVYLSLEGITYKGMEMESTTLTSTPQALPEQPTAYRSSGSSEIWTSSGKAKYGVQTTPPPQPLSQA